MLVRAFPKRSSRFGGQLIIVLLELSAFLFTIALLLAFSSVFAFNYELFTICFLRIVYTVYCLIELHSKALKLISSAVEI